MNEVMLGKLIQVNQDQQTPRIVDAKKEEPSMLREIIKYCPNCGRSLKLYQELNK